MGKSLSGRTAACILWDMVLPSAAMAVAWWGRFVLLPGRETPGSFGMAMGWAALFAPVWPILYALLGAYDLRPERSCIRSLRRLLLADTLGVMLLIDVVFLFRAVDISRWMLLFFALTLDGLSCLRGYLSHCRLRRGMRRGEGVKKWVIIGDGPAARDCACRLAEENGVARVVGSIGERDIPGVKRLGDFARLRSALESSGADQAVIALDGSDAGRLDDVLQRCESTGIPLSLLPVCYRCLTSRPYIEPAAGLPLVNVRRVALDAPWAEVFKRGEDLIGALVLLVLTAPVMIFAAAGTRLSSPGPVIFRQKRIGRDRKPFYLLKFRSMVVNDGSDTAWTRPGDPRRTAFGVFMRRWSIDELPQLFNVLRGDMSLVGPRPEIPRYVDHFKYSVPLYMVRHRVRPGITGWAQVHGLRGDTSIPARVRCDLYYMENWSPLLDLKILLMTPFRGIANPQEDGGGKEGRYGFYQN